MLWEVFGPWPECGVLTMYALIFLWNETWSYFIRAEALQNCLTRRCGVGRGVCWSLGRGTHHAGTKANLTEKEKSCQSTGDRSWSKQVGSQCLCSAASDSVFMLRGGRGNGANQHFHSQRGISMNAPSQGHSPRRANNLLPLCPRHSLNLYSFTPSVPRLLAFSPGAGQCLKLYSSQVHSL